MKQDTKDICHYSGTGGPDGPQRALPRTRFFLLFFGFERKNLSNPKNNKKVQLLRNV
jgi:hypothetical protein